MMGRAWPFEGNKNLTPVKEKSPTLPRKGSGGEEIRSSLDNTADNSSKEKCIWSTLKLRIRHLVRAHKIKKRGTSRRPATIKDVEKRRENFLGRDWA